MKITSLICCVLGALFIGSLAQIRLIAQESKEFNAKAAIENIRGALKKREAAGFCGVLLVRDNNQTLFHEAFGFRDRNEGQSRTVGKVLCVCSWRIEIN